MEFEEELFADLQKELQDKKSTKVTHQQQQNEGRQFPPPMQSTSTSKEESTVAVIEATTNPMTTGGGEQQQQQQPRTLSKKEMNRIERLCRLQETTEQRQTDIAQEIRSREQRDQEHSREQEWTSDSNDSRHFTNSSCGTVSSIIAMSQLELGLSMEGTHDAVHDAVPPTLLRVGGVGGVGGTFNSHTPSGGPHRWGDLSLDQLPRSSGQVAEREHKVQSLESQLDALVDGSHLGSLERTPTNSGGGGRHLVAPKRELSRSSSFKCSDTRSMMQIPAENMSPSSRPSQAPSTEVPTLPTGALAQFNTTSSSVMDRRGAKVVSLVTGHAPSTPTQRKSPAPLPGTESLISQELDRLVDRVAK